MYSIDDFVYRNFECIPYGNPTSDLRVCCPFCEERYGTIDTKYKLYVSINTDRQVVHCFRCGYSDSWLNFIRRYKTYTYAQAMQELRISPGIISKVKDVVQNKFSNKPREITYNKSSLPEDFQPLHTVSGRDSHLALVARNYIKNRGFTISQCARYGVGIAESIGYRVIIPIEDDYWQARALYKWIQPKYINPKVSSARVIFNSGALEMYDEIVICEGAFSAMSIADNAVAIIGKEVGKDRIKRFISAPVEKYYIALEKDAFGTMKVLADALKSADKQVVIWKYNEGDPADSADFEELSYDFAAAVRLQYDL